jgi:Fe-S oxidoreductase
MPKKKINDKTTCKYCCGMKLTFKFKWKHEQHPRHIQKMNRLKWEKYMEDGEGVRVIINDKGETVGLWEEN